MTDLHSPEPNSADPAPSHPRVGQLHPTGAQASLVLALGGGFSRGFAHLGVLEVLEREQIPVGAIVGTSIGGLLGAAYADGISVHDLCELGRRVRLRDFLRFQASEHHPDRNDCLGRFVRDWFRSKNVEDLPIPTMMVTTDLHSGAPHVITKGPIESAIRASCAFPGLLKPVKFDGHLLADGCLAAPVPTAIAARIHGGCVLGVAVSSNTAIAAGSDSAIERLELRSQAMRRWALEPSWYRHADVMLEPEVHHIVWNDFSRVDEAFDAGAVAMRHALPRLRELLELRARSEAALKSLAPAESGSAL